MRQGPKHRQEIAKYQSCRYTRHRRNRKCWVLLMSNQDLYPQIIDVTRIIVIMEIIITRTTVAPELGITYKRLLFADSEYFILTASNDMRRAVVLGLIFKWAVALSEFQLRLNVMLHDSASIRDVCGQRLLDGGSWWDISNCRVRSTETAPMHPPSLWDQ